MIVDALKQFPYECLERKGKLLYLIIGQVRFS